MRKGPLISLVFALSAASVAAACSSDPESPAAAPEVDASTPTPTPTQPAPDGSAPDAAKPPSETTFAVAAPVRDFAETRRLLRAVVTDADGIAKVSYVLNGGAPVALAVQKGATSATVTAALAVGPGANTVNLVVVDERGTESTQEIPFRFGAVTTGGGSHSGVVANGKAYVFGRNNVGQLGLGVADPSLSTATALSAYGSPALPAAPTPASLAFNQNISVLVTDKGDVFAWGENTNGELGQGDSGTATRRNVPTAVPSLTDVAIAATGFGHVVVLKKDGSLLAWGKNDVGQVGVAGNGTTTDLQTSPIAVASAPKDVVKIVAGSAHTVALTVDGKVWVWGRNEYGNLGQGGAIDENRHPVPTAVPGLADVVDIATGRDHVLAVKADGTLVSWGLGASGQLGQGQAGVDASPKTAPDAVLVDEATKKPIADVAQVFANGTASFALSKTGALWGFGEDGNGTLAQGGAGGEGFKANRLLVAGRAGVYASPGGVPEYLDQRAKYRALSVGALHVVALTDKNEVFSWGWNTQGTLGIPDFPGIWRQPTPVVVKIP